MKTFKQIFEQNTKETIVTDIDGCVLDFSTPYQKYIKDNYPEIKINQNEYNLGIPDNMIDDVVQGFFKHNKLGNLKFYSNAKEVLNKLSMKYNLIIASAINKEYQGNRKKNLSGLKYDKMYLKAIGKMEFVIRKIKPEIAIEDKPKNIKKLAKAGIKVYYPKFVPYTKGMESYGTGFKSWKELEGMLLK